MISAKNAKNDLEGVRLKSAKFSELNSADESDCSDLAWALMMNVRKLTLLSLLPEGHGSEKQKGMGIDNLDG